MLGQTTTPLALRPNETKIHFFSQYPQTATSRCPKGDGTPSPPSIVSSQSPLASEIHRVSNEETPSLPPATSSADRMLASSRAVAYASAGLGKMGQDISALNSLMDTVLNEEGTWSNLTKEDKKEANGVLDAWTPLNNGREKILPTSELTEGEYIARMKKVLYRIMSNPLFREGEVPYVVAPVVTAHLTKEGPVFSTHFARMSATDAFGELPLGAQLRQEKKMLSTLRGALPGAAGLTSSMRLPDHPSSPEALGSIFTEAYSLVRSAAQSAGVRESTTLSDLAELCRNSAASDPRSLSPAPDDATQTVVTEQGPDTADTRVPSVGGSTA
ncbi:hypothetical protein DB88DRAFT_518658 [Papiliotrema laurentii]|uniref:Uncharacterized protein n=1 Tax=Papiliotrema laurentii TaxID=5418 RepID=A0AAD9CTP7_PAPLA|nr:hypothetical protein DB88DRAFT_518658 [Papiliotrema laurentii]